MSNIPVPIETSARHVHLSEADFKVLYGDNASLTPTKQLSQPGQYACKERVTIVGPKAEIKNVSILGPFRNDSQVEISMTDARKVGVPGIIRQSGLIEGTPGCRLIGPCGELVMEKGVIVAKRHIHMTPSDARRMHLKDNDNVFVITQSFERALIFADVVVRVNKNFALAMHVDTDEANAFAGEKNPQGVILKLFEGNTYNLQAWADELLEGINR